MLNVTRERVRQIEAKALKKLRPPCYATRQWNEMDPAERIEAFVKYHEENRARKRKGQ